MDFLKRLLNYLRIKALLTFKGDNKAVVFYLPIGELQFIQKILIAYATKKPKDLIFIAHPSDNVSARKAFNISVPLLAPRVIHLNFIELKLGLYNELDLFISSEQYSLGIKGIFSICIFHGQPAKALTFTRAIIESFDAFFLYGPLQKQTFDDYINENPGIRHKHLKLYEVGYTKSDDLINGFFSREETLNNLNLDFNNKTILYAPAFNDKASLRECGQQIIRVLCQNREHNVIVKLPVDCLKPTTDYYATGGIDWFHEIKRLEGDFPNLRLFREHQIDKALACADVLITCVSSVGFEFLALNKPVIFIDTPEFFSKYLQARFPYANTKEWANRTTVNGGREFGLTVSDVNELPRAIEYVLRNPQEFPRQQDRLKKFLLYNPGTSTNVAIETIERILAEGPQSLKPDQKINPFKEISVRAFLGFMKILYKNLNRLLNRFGFVIHRMSPGYIDAEVTIKAARSANLSICEYLERKEEDVRKRGRRDRIVSKINERIHLESCKSIVEIGAGTGMYLEKIIKIARPLRYEIYETDSGWSNFLLKTYKDSLAGGLIVHPADGETLKASSSNSCDLVHAHAVFVYIPALQTFSYILESSRVLKKGGRLIFDCYLDSSFGCEQISFWLASLWRFPVIFSEGLLVKFAETHGFLLKDRFIEIHGPSSVDYLIFEKTT